MARKQTNKQTHSKQFTHIAQNMRLMSTIIFALLLFCYFSLVHFAFSHLISNSPAVVCALVDRKFLITICNCHKLNHFRRPSLPLIHSHHRTFYRVTETISIISFLRPMEFCKTIYYYPINISYSRCSVSLSG